MSSKTSLEEQKTHIFFFIRFVNSILQKISTKVNNKNDKK